MRVRREVRRTKVDSSQGVDVARRPGRAPRAAVPAAVRPSSARPESEWDTLRLPPDPAYALPPPKEPAPP